jgi:pimeloyl-ACP methyl ester carboxylesterase
MRLIDALTRSLGIERFVLVGTSSGGTVAYRYAAAHPDRVARLVLINSAGMPRTVFNDPNRARGGAVYEWIIEQYRWPAWWRDSLSLNMPSGPPPDWLVAQAYDFNRRDTLRDTDRLVRKTYHTGPPQTVLPQITAPTLILWGEKNPTVMHLEADVIEHWMTGAATTIRKYPDLGHYPYIERPRDVAADILAFTDGSLDSELRRTARVQP